jgi:alginate O-acetyltransferase complex protein AlgI
VIFNTWTFAIFGFTVILVYWTIVPARLRPYYLVVAGTIFYTWAVPAYTLLIGALGIVTYAIGKAMLRSGPDRRRLRLLLALGVVLVTGVLVLFKYSKFFALTVDQVAARNIIPIPQLVVPLAISFFTFEFVHVLVDIYLGKIRRLDALDFAVFTMFFPSLVAGPIKRFQSFAPQLHPIVEPAPQEVALHLYRIAVGVTKKMVLADSMSLFTQAIVTPGAPYGRMDYWIGVLAYAAKIYFDFTGYSDIAIGLAGLLGLAIPENFERPYWAENISAFWSRWHISLSTWIRDYVFIPLGGSRRPAPVVLANLLLAMAISGLWHGAAWTFVVWGLWHGAGLAFHRVWSSTVVPLVPVLANGSPAVRVASVVTTFGFVVLGWVLFATSSLATAGVVFAGMVR